MNTADESLLDVYRFTCLKPLLYCLLLLCIFYSFVFPKRGLQAGEGCEEYLVFMGAFTQVTVR